MQWPRYWQESAQITLNHFKESIASHMYRRYETIEEHVVCENVRTKRVICMQRNVTNIITQGSTRYRVV